MLHCINKNHTLEALSISKLHQSGRHSAILSGCDQMFGCTCALSAYHTHEQLIKTACIVETTEMESLMRRAFIGIVADWTCYEPIGIQVWGPRVARSNQAAYLSSQINIQLETRNSARSRSRKATSSPVLEQLKSGPFLARPKKKFGDLSRFVRSLKNPACSCMQSLRLISYLRCGIIFFDNSLTIDS